MANSNHEHYVTLFDSAFLPQGLALYRSLSRMEPSFRLWAVCVDQSAFETLSALHLNNITPVEISRIETLELNKVKDERTRAEYCWTLTPFVMIFILNEIGDACRATYLDADLWFRKHPHHIFDLFEKSSANVLITAHNYAPEHDRSELAGIYCVQFIVFKKYGSEDILERWSRQCLDWCFNRHENGKFGDQKYLDEWPSRYGERVYVLDDKNAFLAPWNVGIVPYSQSMVYHFHGARISGSGHLVVGEYSIPQVVIDYIYKPYVMDLSESIALLKCVGFKIIPQINSPSFGVVARCSIKPLIKNIKKAVREAISQTIRIPYINGQ